MRMPGKLTIIALFIGIARRLLSLYSRLPFSLLTRTTQPPILRGKNC